jgi:hypothetical protein
MGVNSRKKDRRNACARLILVPDWKPTVWAEEERKKGQAWGLKTIESFHTPGHAAGWGVMFHRVRQTRLSSGRTSATLVSVAADRTLSYSAVVQI